MFLGTKQGAAFWQVSVQWREGGASTLVVGFIIVLLGEAGDFVPMQI